MAISDYQLLYMQKRLVEKQYTCFRCSIQPNGQSMKCKGYLQPLEYIGPYQVEIFQLPGSSPKVFIMSPVVKYNPGIHMYKAGNLCLYYPPDLNWKVNTSIAHYTIPWVNEWIVYYELFKITGVWEGPAAPHRIDE